MFSQTHQDIEYIIIDGGSTDGTVEIIKKHENKISKWLSEPDKGIYDGLNKGIRLATGDIVGILNSDDVYANEFIMENVVNTILENNVDSCYGKLFYNQI